ncbi:MAG: hypothetical protein VXW32_08725 [Myxococcota bacterium]|nr:hypothetical protein [Myxococcota bacterium]
MQKPMGEEVRAMVKRLKRWSASEMEQRRDAERSQESHAEAGERPDGGFLLPSLVVA